ncbi:MAG: sulfite exporter TauE/SafE family protein [Alphaproteobacteria bacterium]|nr:sulfite exporter TauE/SafE family protein [Alphaproteobacteria bacterium]MBV8407406.1 sulfite exporter TauE/SafE family protein [Alphaproteobacteria bacterium]
MTYVLVLIVGFVAGTVSGIVGTGATIILLPILVFAFGPRQAVPIMAVVALMSNVAKVTSWWREIDWRAAGAYALGGIPAAALGARTLLILPEHAVDVALGVFFLAMVPGRRWLARRNLTLGLGGLGAAGAVIGFLTGIVVSTGPLSVPAFTAYGLVKGAFIATEAAGSLALYISKALTFRQFGALPLDILLKGLISGSSVMAGTYTARLIVERLSVTAFQRLLDGVMVLSGLALLWAAIR